MRDFAYLEPTTVAEACAMLKSYGGEARLYAGGVGAGVQTYTSSGGAYSQATIQTAAGNAGGANTLDVLGKRLLIGSPSSASSAGAVALFDASTGNSLNLSLHPFWVKDNKMASDPTAGRQFGVGGSIISEGHYVVGSDPTDSNLSQILYNFRQRGPAQYQMA